MSLSVNLIMPYEQRSGSKVNARTLTKIFLVACPLMLLVLLLQQALSYYVLQTNLRIMESRWELAEPRQQLALRQQGRLSQHRNIKAELQAWSHSSPAWDSVLYAILESTPETIQIISLRLQANAAPDSPQEGSPPLRRPTLLIEGRVSEPDAMPNITQLKHALEEHHFLEQAIYSSEVVNFAAASSEPADPLRVFSIRIQFHDLPGDES